MAAAWAAPPSNTELKIRRWFVLALAAGATASAAVMAQDAAPAGPLSRAVDAAWQRAVAAREARGREQVAHARQAAARAWTPQAPSAEIMQRNGPSGARETELGVGAPIWLPNRRSALRAAADAEADAARVAQRAARWRVAGEVRELAWVLASQHAELAAARDQRQSLQALAADVDRRVQAGDLARSDALVATAESLAAQAALDELEQRTAAVAARWTALTGMAPLDDPSEPAADLSAAPPHPELALARQELERARLQALSVRSARRDPPEIAVTWRQERAGSPSSRENSVGVALRIPFGTDARHFATEAAALAEVELAEVQAERLEERLAIEQRTARAALEAAQRQLDGARSRVALLRERAQLLDKSFHAGETSLPDLLRARGAAAQAEAALARQHAAAGLARARLHQSVGVLP
jgi:outer membrane protein TolC